VIWTCSNHVCIFRRWNNHTRSLNHLRIFYWWNNPIWFSIHICDINVCSNHVWTYLRWNNHTRLMTLLWVEITRDDKKYHDLKKISRDEKNSQLTRDKWLSCESRFFSSRVTHEKKSQLTRESFISCDYFTFSSRVTHENHTRFFSHEKSHEMFFTWVIPSRVIKSPAKFMSDYFTSNKCCGDYFTCEK